jgi:hypothetical protein
MLWSCLSQTVLAIAPFAGSYRKTFFHAPLMPTRRQKILRHCEKRASL